MVTRYVGEVVLYVRIVISQNCDMYNYIKHLLPYVIYFTFLSRHIEHSLEINSYQFAIEFFNFIKNFIHYNRSMLTNKSNELRMYGVYICNQKFDSIRISVLRDITKIWKKSPISRISRIFRAELILTRSNLRSSLRLNLRSSLVCSQFMNSELRVSFITHFSCQKVKNSQKLCQIFFTQHSVQAEDNKILQLQS